ncbi:hypothetical protein [Cupriavidus pauculus]|uniref:hypothetical protein n=1 Tax=Cupriavidus pauculus TaxID=82633 RepID=UPI001D0C80A3|nr:hypothetical protein [Cupriavidus pauculus]
MHKSGLPEVMRDVEHGVLTAVQVNALDDAIRLNCLYPFPIEQCSPPKTTHGLLYRIQIDNNYVFCRCNDFDGGAQAALMSLLKLETTHPVTYQSMPNETGPDIPTTPRFGLQLLWLAQGNRVLPCRNHQWNRKDAIQSVIGGIVFMVLGALIGAGIYIFNKSSVSEEWPALLVAFLIIVPGCIALFMFAVGSILALSAPFGRKSDEVNAALQRAKNNYFKYVSHHAAD